MRQISEELYKFKEIQTQEACALQAKLGEKTATMK